MEGRTGCPAAPPRRPRCTTTHPARLLLAVLSLLIGLLACSAKTSGPEPTPSRSVADYRAIEEAIENKISTGSVALDNVRAVLVSVDGKATISHYRHGFTSGQTTHIQSVTKSVVSTLVGIAVRDGMIRGLDEPLARLLPAQRPNMSPAVAAVSLRQLLTMSAGFPSDYPQPEIDKIFERQRDLVGYLLRRGQTTPAGTQFVYSNGSAHLVAAVLATALRSSSARHQSVLDFARKELFDPLGIPSRPAFHAPLPDTALPAFRQAGFGWGTDPQGIEVGAYGLRLTPPDLLKLGELYLDDGVWQGKRILPPGWVTRATTPSATNPQYGLLWWLHDWNGHRVWVALGSDGHLIAVEPDSRLVVAIASANDAQYEMNPELLFPLVNEVIMPALDRR